MSEYQLYFQLWFEIYGTPQAPLTKERSDPLIRRLRESLEKFRFEFQGGTVKAWVQRLDFAGARIVHSGLAQGRYENILFQVVDNNDDNSERCYTFNNLIRGAIGKELMKLEFSYYHTRLKIVKVESS